MRPSQTELEPGPARAILATMAGHVVIQITERPGGGEPLRTAYAVAFIGAQKNKVECNAKTSDLIRWSIQEIRRIAQRLARKRIQPADVIAWSLWRRAHHVPRPVLWTQV